MTKRADRKFLVIDIQEGTPGTGVASSDWNTHVDTNMSVQEIQQFLRRFILTYPHGVSGERRFHERRGSNG